MVWNYKNCTLEFDLIIIDAFPTQQAETAQETNALFIRAPLPSTPSYSER
jgi:hypothetical protein